MADAIATFALVLEDALSPGARQAKASISALSTSLAKAKTELSGYQSQLAIAKDLGDVEGYRKYSALVNESKRSVFGLAQQLESTPAGLEASAASAGSMAVGLGLVTAAAGVAVAAIGALMSVTESFIVKSLEVVNANQRMAATFEALGQQGEGSGKKTMAMLGDLSSKLPQSRDQLADWAKKIEAMGVTDLSKVRSELIATASAQAIMGDEGAAAYTKIQERVRLAVEAHHGLKLAEKSLKALYSAGVNMTEVAARMGLSTQELGAKLKGGTIDAAKFGDALRGAVTDKGKGPLDVMMNSLETMGVKAKAAFGRLFSDVDTKPLTDALRSVIALGDAGAPSGEALKSGITGGLNAVIKTLGAAIIEAEVFFLSVEVRALQAYIALKPLIGAVGKIGDVMGAIGMGKDQAVGGAAGALGVDPGGLEQQGLRAGALVYAGFGGPMAQTAALVLDTLFSIGDDKAQEIAREGGKKSGEAAIAGIREGVQAHSPSLAAIRIGMDIGAGLGAGMEGSPTPARAARVISGNALGGIAGGAAGLGAANTNAGAVSNVVHVTINAPEGVTDAHELSVIGLATALERFQIGSGR